MKFALFVYVVFVNGAVFIDEHEVARFPNPILCEFGKSLAIEKAEREMYWLIDWELSYAECREIDE